MTCRGVTGRVTLSIVQLCNTIIAPRAICQIGGSVETLVYIVHILSTHEYLNHTSCSCMHISHTLTHMHTLSHTLTHMHTLSHIHTASRCSTCQLSQTCCSDEAENSFKNYIVDHYRDKILSKLSDPLIACHNHSVFGKLYTLCLHGEDNFEL